MANYRDHCLHTDHYYSCMHDHEHHDLSSFGGVVIFAIVVWTIIQSTRNNARIGRANSRGAENAGSGAPGMLQWFLSLFTLLKPSDPETQARQAASAARQNEIITAIKQDKLPESMRARLEACRDGTSPWIATLTPPELLIARSHGIRPIAAVSASCWLSYGFSWTNGHAQGWKTALKRLQEEARAAGANAVVDVKMRTVSLDIANSMDFTLIGTAVKIDGLPPSPDPVIATVPALEFVKLLEANIVPTGIAIGAEYRWITDWRGGTNLFFAGNTECTTLTDLWKYVRDRAHYQLRQNLQGQGNGALAHINFSQMFESEANNAKQYLARHIVIATTIDMHEAFSPGLRALTNTSETLPLHFKMVVDMQAGKTPLQAASRHHESYASNEQEGAI